MVVVGGSGGGSGDSRRSVAVSLMVIEVVAMWVRGEFVVVMEVQWLWMRNEVVADGCGMRLWVMEVSGCGYVVMLG